MVAGKLGSSSRFTSFFTPFDLTLSPCRVKSEGVKKAVKRLEEPGFLVKWMVDQLVADSYI